MGKIREKLLLARLKSRDKKAFIKAYEIYSEPIFRFIYYKVGNLEEAKDLTSAVFLKSWQHAQAHQKVEAKTLRALFYKVARNVIVDHYRQQIPTSSLDNSTDEDGMGIDVVDKGQDLIKQMEISSDINQVEQALLKMKDEYREVIIMRYVQEMSITEIADILDKSKGAVRVLAFRALAALKEIMNK